MATSLRWNQKKTVTVTSQAVALITLKNHGKVVVIHFTKHAYLRPIFVNCANNSFPRKFTTREMLQEMPFSALKIKMMRLSLLKRITLAKMMQKMEIIHQIQIQLNQPVKVI